MTPGRVERRKSAARERIIAAAMELFGRKGIEATTVAEIADAADIAKGTFFTHFPTKEALMPALGQVLLEKMAFAAEQSEGASAREAIRQFLLAGIDWHEANRDLSRVASEIYMRNATFMKSEVANIDAVEQFLEGLVAQGQDSGEFAPQPTNRPAALALLSLYFASVWRWHQGGAKAPLRGMVAAAIELLLRGLAR